MNDCRRPNALRQRLAVSAVFALSFISLNNLAYAQQEVSLLGKWQLSDQTLTVNIAPCKDSADLCATVVEEVLQPGETSLVGSLVVTQIRKQSKGGWRGKFTDGKSEINVVITAKSNDLVDFKGCAFLVLCETQSYKRVS
jgi:uncharacterized protein (DUF2147 family)